MNRVSKFFVAFNEKGLCYAIKQVFENITYHLRAFFKIDDPITRRRRVLSAFVNEKCSNTISYGPFLGLKFSSEKAWWGSLDRASMLLGFYEKEILNALLEVPSKYKVLINLGAGDGYYSIGSIHGKLFDRAYAYEASENGRKIIKKNADINNVLDRIKIFGHAGKDFYRGIPVEDIGKSVLLVDIEGGEFELFDDYMFSLFRKSIIIIEIHDFFVENGVEKLRHLREMASKYFSIKELFAGSRNPSAYLELNDLRDDDRWLICSEGRPRKMVWYQLTPLNC